MVDVLRNYVILFFSLIACTILVNLVIRNNLSIKMQVIRADTGIGIYASQTKLLIKPNKGLCRNKTFIAIIHVRSLDVKKREEWRILYTPFKKKYNFEMIFAIGRTGRDQDQEVLAKEAKITGDILQGDFVDTYYNITYKQLTHLYYVEKHCDTPFIVKLDDDMVFNVEKAWNILTQGKGKNVVAKEKLNGNKIWCYLWKHAPVRHQGKWNVSSTEKWGKVYPDYCAGMAYFMTNMTVSKLAEASQDSKFFWIDDIFITGLLAKKANTTLCSIRDLYMRNNNNNSTFKKKKPLFTLTKREKTADWFKLLELA